MVAAGRRLCIVWVKVDRDAKAMDTRTREVVIANINVMVAKSRLLIWGLSDEGLHNLLLDTTSMVGIWWNRWSWSDSPPALERSSVVV